MSNQMANKIHLTRLKLTNSVDGRRRGSWFEELQMKIKPEANTVFSSVSEGEILSHTALLFHRVKGTWYSSRSQSHN